MRNSKRLQLVILISFAAALLFVSGGPLSQGLPRLFGGTGNYLARTSEYFPGQSLRTDPLHASSSGNRSGGSMATINVSTTAQLPAALSSAHAGDTILLAAGNYLRSNSPELQFSATPVTITSADADASGDTDGSERQASSGLNFTNLELDAIGTRLRLRFPGQRIVEHRPLAPVGPRIARRQSAERHQTSCSSATAAM